MRPEDSTGMSRCPMPHTRQSTVIENKAVGLEGRDQRWRAIDRAGVPASRCTPFLPTV